MSHYNDVLEELKKKKEKLASEYITKMYIILRDEECRPPEECRAKIESDCSDIWSEDTIRRYLPIEVKNTAKRKAGKISAEVKKKKANEAMIKEAKPLVVKSGSRSSSGQMSALIDSLVIAVEAVIILLEWIQQKTAQLGKTSKNRALFKK